MTTAIVVPELGTGRKEVRVSCWLADVGDDVETGDRVAELLIRGMTFDVAAPMPGVLVRISKPIDTVVSAGDILGWIENRPIDTGDDEYGDLI